MDRAPMPREVRPALGPFVEAVPLLFRQETLEVAGILAVSGLVLPAIWEWWPGRLTPLMTLPGGVPLYPSAIAIEFGGVLLRIAAVLLLVPVACGVRHLRPRILLDHFGPMAMATAVTFGAVSCVRLGLHLLSENFGGRLQTEMSLGWSVTFLESWLATWAGWFLWNAIRRRERQPVARRALLAWPGLGAAALTAGMTVLLLRSGLLPMMAFDYQLPVLAVQAFFAFLWNLLLLFAAIWMVRVVENDADDRLPNGLASAA